MRQAIRSQRVVTPEGVRAATVIYEDGRIVSVDEALPDKQLLLLDVEDRFVLPGLVDTHVHINSPGRTDWEGFATASRAAAAGGITCLVDMPLNSIPSTTNVTALEQKRRLALNDCLVDHAFWGGAVSGNEADLLPLAEAGVSGFKSFLVHPGIDEFSMVSEEELKLAMPLIAKSGLPLLVHAEDPAVIASAQTAITGDPRRYATYLQSRPTEAEVAAIGMMIRLCREFHCRVHIVHVATAEAIPLLRVAKQEGLPITAETCPHYLCFAAEDIPDSATEFKCAPPIRDRVNREALWDALREGVIDLVATDHSPCPPSMKQIGAGDFLQAWGGIASLSLALSVMWTEAQKRGSAIQDVVRWMSEHPARLAGFHMQKGGLTPGRDADFVVFDPAEHFTPQSSALHFRHAVTPYLDRPLLGRVKMTFVRGKKVFDNGNFEAHCGRECPSSEVYSK